MADADQIAHEIVEFLMAEPRSVVSRHQRSRLVFHALQFRLHEEMERTIHGLKLQRKVVFVTRDSSQSFPLHGGHEYGSLSRIEIFIGIRNCTANVICGPTTGIA